MNGIRIDADDFAKETPLQQSIIIFKNTEKIIDLFEAHKGVCEGRFTKIETKKTKDTLLSSVTGAVGGYLFMIVDKWLK